MIIQKAIPVRRSHPLVCRFWSHDGLLGSNCCKQAWVLKKAVIGM